MRFEDDEFAAVRTRWYDACRDMQNAIEKALESAVRDVYPTAIRVVVIGEGDVDHDILRLHEVIGPDGVLADFDEHQTQEFDDLTDLVDQYLDWMLELDDELFGRHELDFDPLEAADATP